MNNKLQIGGAAHSAYYTEERPELSSRQLIEQECDSIKEMLLQKNKKYGDSALNPIRIFSKAGPTDQLRDRIDDKLTRIAKGVGDDEDTILDLIGYLVMLRISEKIHKEEK